MRSDNEVKRILAENENRKSLYFRDYSREEGDHDSESVQRKAILINGKTIYLPESMFSIPIVGALEKYGSFSAIIEKTYKPEQRVKDLEALILRGFYGDRFKHDFEFWAVTCVRIQDKLTKQPIPFKLNRGQRKLLGEYERQRLAEKPIRTIIVKARQWGGSTLTQIYMLWLQLFHFENWHSAIVSQFKTQAVNIRNMLAKTLKRYPRTAGVYSFDAVGGTQSVRQITERGCEIQIGSAEEPDSIRSFDIAMAHLSEVAFWAETAQKSGEDLAQAIYAAIPDMPGTFICLESTAKGIGNFFHEKWLSAESGNSELHPVFVSWFEIEMYTKPIKNYKTFLESMSQYNWWQWYEGATLEGINWYNTYKSGKNYSDFQMRSEFPTTAAEAFQAKSGRFYTDEAINKCRETCRAPIWIGDIKGDSYVGKAALNNISIYEKNSGGSELLKIWEHPEQYDEEKMLYQYLVVVDIGGKHFKSDNSVISVFNRAALMSPFGALEKCAEWVGHIDHDILAWKAAQIAEYYNHAFIVIESNTLDTRDKKKAESILYEGDHFFTVIDELADEYDNLYARTGTPDKAIETGKPTKFGWHMNKKTKYQAYDRLVAAIRDDEYIERSHEAVNEMQWLQIKPTGQIEASVGKRDDIQDTTAIGVYIGFEEMPLPKIVSLRPNSQAGVRTKKSVGVAGF